MIKKFAIRNNRLVSQIDVAPFSEEVMDRWCEQNEFDNWFYLDLDAIKILNDFQDKDTSLAGSVIDNRNMKENASGFSNECVRLKEGSEQSLSPDSDTNDSIGKELNKDYAKVVGSGK